MHLKEVVIQQHTFPSREAYPFSLPLFQKTDRLDLSSTVTIFAGENGTGKTTLLKALCQKCKIHIWEGRHRRRYEVNPFENRLPESLQIEWVNGPVPGSFFSPELFRNYSQLVDEWAVTNPGILNHYGGNSLMTKSHGQSTMAYFRSMYQVRGLHFLDEPEAALSPRTQLELLHLLTEMAQAGHAQFIISTHSPILMSCEQAAIFSFDGEVIRQVPYRETMHYQIYHRFFTGG
ncbi:MAG: AAA family ATPase [bacterium]